MELVDALGKSYERAEKVIGGIRPEQLGDPTPCAEWDVKTLLTHTVGVVAGIGAGARGEAPSDPNAFALSDDPAGQFRTEADKNLAAWRAPGIMDAEVNAGAGPMPGRVYASINLLDIATHTWDLARATGQDAALDPDVATLALELSRQVIVPEIRPGRFAPEVAAPATDPTSRLVAFLGREP